MNTNLRAILFGAAVAATLAIALNTVFAAEPVPVVRLDAVQVIAHRDASDAADAVDVVRLAPVMVIAHKTVD